MLSEASTHGVNLESRHYELLAAAGVRPPGRKDVLRVRSSHWDAQVIFPLKSVPLDPDVRHRYVLSQLGVRVDPGEVYHERSKLHRGAGREQVHRELEQTHLSVFCTLTLNGYIDLIPENGKVVNGFYDKVDHFPEDVRALCAVAGQDPRVLYAADLYLLLKRAGRIGLYRYYLGDDALNLLREVPAERVRDLAALVPNVGAWPDPEAGGAQDAILAAFIVGSIGRMFLVYEDSAYRLCVLRAGQLTSAIQLWARMSDMDPRAYDAFYDDELNQFLGVEGVTKTLLSIVTF